MPFGVMPSQNFNGYPGQTNTNPFVARYVMRIQSTRVDQFMGVSSSLIAAGVASFYAVIVATPKTPKIFGIARYASDRLRRRVKAELSAAAIAATATKM